MNVFKRDSPQTFIIVIESSLPWSLCKFKALIILRISSPLKAKELSLDWVRNLWLMGSTLLLG